MPFWLLNLSSSRSLISWGLVSTKQASDELFYGTSVFGICRETMGKFPTLVTYQESLESKVNETKATVEFQLKKVLCMGVAVGNVAMEEKKILQNVQMSVNFLVSLLKKNWQNTEKNSLQMVGSLHGHMAADCCVLLFGTLLE